MARTLLVLVVLVSVFLASCSALGYVPQEELEAAQAAQARAENERDTAQAQAEELESQIGALEGRVADLDEVQADLAAAQRTINGLTGDLAGAEGRLAELICPDHDWDEVLDEVGLWPVAPPTWGEVDDSFFAVFETEWNPAGQPPVEGAYWTLLLMDNDEQPALIIDTRENCVILNPDFWGVGFFR